MTGDGRIKLSNRILPYYKGLTADLLFWVAVRTLFLSEVKGFTAAEISGIFTVGPLISLICYPLVIFTISKIGTLNSTRLGAVMQCISALIYTFGTEYYMMLTAQAFFEVGYSFKVMDASVIKKDLTYEHREGEYLKTLSKSSLIYSVTTAVISFISGFVYNADHYLPMYFCIGFCVIGVILSFIITEAKNETDGISEKGNGKGIKFKFTAVLLLLFAIYAFLHNSISVSQNNGQLFIQYKLEYFLKPAAVSVVLSTVIAISRIVRIFSDIVFIKVSNRVNYGFLIIVQSVFAIALLCIGGGFAIGNHLVGVIIMALGYLLVLIIRDPAGNYLTMLMMKNCSEEESGKVLQYNGLIHKCFSFGANAMATLILTGHSIVMLSLVLIGIVMISVAATIILIKRLNV